MGFLKNKNYAFSTLAGDISNVATSLAVVSGEGIKYPQTGNFVGVIWGSAYATPSLDATAELVLATLTSGDTFTITRAQEGTSNKAWSAGDNFACVLSARKIDELEEYIQSGIASFGYATGTNAYTAVMDPAITAYADGLTVRLKFNNTSTGAVTLALNALTAKKVYHLVSGSLIAAGAGVIIASMRGILVYDSSLDGAAGGWVLINNPNTLAVTLDTDTDISGKSWVVDEDTMSSNLATKVPTQRSVKAYVDARSFTGEVKVWAGTVAAIPSGWHLCDGSAVSRVAYSNLFSVIGTIYGSGDGSTTFNLPDLTDRFVLHADADSGGTNDVGESGGSRTITDGNLPTHTHAAGTLAAETAGEHQHTVNVYIGGVSSSNASAYASSTGYQGTASTSAAGSHSHTVSGNTGSVGSGDDYIPRYIAMSYIIKL